MNNRKRVSLLAGVMMALLVVATEAQGLTHTVTVKGVSGAQAIAAGSAHSMVLKNDGTVVAWGENDYGQATPPAGLAGITAIAAGDSRSVALQGEGTVVTWGRESDGVFMAPAGLSGVVAIAAGYYHGVALQSDATVVTWGRNTYGYSTVPEGLAGVTAVAAGDYHTLARTGDGTIVAWGNNIAGQVTLPEGLAGVTAVAAGGYHSLALQADGTVVAWGGNSGGQATVPPGLSGVTALAAGYLHSVALQGDGTVVAWGDNDYGQSQVPADLAGVVAIAAGDYHTLALKGDGTVVAWGDDRLGQATVPAGMTNAISHGAITCESPVLDQASSLCTVSPENGYHLAALVVNGVDRLPEVTGNSFTIAGIQTEQTVAAAFTADTVPGPPIIGTASLAIGQVLVSFTPPLTDGGRPITGYTVTASPGGGIQASGPASPIAVSGLTIGATYTFTVTATNAVGTGPASSPSKAIMVKYQYGAVLDAPHNPYHGVSCADCHTYSLWWRYAPLSSADPEYGGRTDALCLKCHGQGTAPINAVHSAEAMGPYHDPALGVWTAKCLDCHDPHRQAQLNWRATDANNLYLATGVINGNVQYQVQAGETTFSYTDLVVPNSAWDPSLADWGWKNPAAPRRGLILVEDIAAATNTFEVMAVSPLTATITVKGALDPAAVGTSFGVIYGRMIKSSLATPLSGVKAVKFYDPGLTHAAGGVGGLTDPLNPTSPQGLCQVCHTKTQSWTTDGNGADHQSGQVCTACHDLRQGFRPGP